MECEIYAVIDEGETLMKAGNVLIQRGAAKPRATAPANIAVSPSPLRFMSSHFPRSNPHRSGPNQAQSIG